MPGRKVVKDPIGILVFDDEFNHIKFVVDLLSQTFGFPPTQAYQCANLIHERGSYVVKVLTYKEKQKAELLRNILVSNGLMAKIIPM
jgi:ATP-dependent Clp protease adapter protein ClpS